MSRIEVDELKELFAEWGLWSLVDDISPDGDGHGDNLELTKEGLEAERMINQLLEEKTEQSNKVSVNGKEWKERYIERYAERDRICKKCGHPEGMHYWNGAGNDMYAGFSTCLVDGCHCVYDEKNMEEVIVKESVEDEIDFIEQLLSEKTFSKEELEFLQCVLNDNETVRYYSNGGDGYIGEYIEPILEKIYKLLDEENEHIKTHKKFLKLAKKQKELGERLKEILDRNSWEEEVYDGDDYSMVEYFDKETITKELIDFISQLLSERTFSKEELELILYNINYNDGDEVIYLADDEEVGKLKSKIYNLLREKE